MAHDLDLAAMRAAAEAAVPTASGLVQTRGLSPELVAYMNLMPPATALALLDRLKRAEAVCKAAVAWDQGCANDGYDADDAYTDFRDALTTWKATRA